MADTKTKKETTLGRSILEPSKFGHVTIILPNERLFEYRGNILD